MSCGRLHVLCEYCFFWLCAAAGRVLVPQEGIEPMPPAVEARIRNHWNTMEFPECRILIFFPWCQITSWSFFFVFWLKTMAYGILVSPPQTTPRDLSVKGPSPNS